MSETRSLHKKLAQVMFEAERIPKRGKAPAAMGGFGFVQVGDAADYIRKALAEHVISMTPTQIDVIGQTEHTTAKGGTMTTLDIRVTWTLTDGESGEATTIVSYGAGADTGDKYSGKAMTNAMKYALLAGFLLSTGDDVELADTSDRRQPTTEAGRADAENVVNLQERARLQNGSSYPAGEWSTVGVATVGKAPVDGELRETPDGGVFGFVVQGEDGKKYQVLAEREYALPTSLAWESMRDQRVHVAGPSELVNWGPKNARGEWQRPPYRLIRATRIEGPDFVIPATIEQEPHTVEELQVQTEFEAEMDAVADSLGLVDARDIMLPEEINPGGR